jgi:hypothetical protein
MVVIAGLVPPSSWIVFVVCLSAAAWKGSLAWTSPGPPPPSPSSRRGFLAESQLVAAVPLLLQLPSDTARALEHRNNNDEAQSGAERGSSSLVSVLPPLPRTIVVPIEYVPDLSAYICRFRLGNNGNDGNHHNNDFCGIIDTGSPFLTVPSYCATSSSKTVWDGGPKWGCYDARNDDGSAGSDEIEDVNEVRDCDKYVRLQQLANCVQSNAHKSNG